MSTRPAKLAATAGPLIVAVLVTIFGPRLGSHVAGQIAGYVTTALAAILAAQHAPTAAHKTRRIVKHRIRRKPWIMVDSTNLGLVPRKLPDAVLAYVDGLYQNVQTARRLWPRAKIATLSVLPGGPMSDGIDVEAGALNDDQAVVEVKRRLAAGVKRVIVYASLSRWPALFHALQSAGITRAELRMIDANWNGAPPGHYRLRIDKGYDATQCAGGVTAPYDVSCCKPDFFD